MNIGVSSCLGAVWKDVFNNDALEVLVGVWSISEVESDVIRVLLTVAGHCYNNRARYLHRLRLHNNVSVRCGLYIIHNHTEAHLLVAHVWMVQALTNDIDHVGLVHWSIWRLDLLDVWIIIIEESTIGFREGLSVGRDRHVVEVISSVTISEVEYWRVAPHGIRIYNGCVRHVSLIELACSFTKVVLVEILASDVDLGVSSHWSAAWFDGVNDWHFEVSINLNAGVESIFTVLDNERGLTRMREWRRNTLKMSWTHEFCCYCVTTKYTYRISCMVKFSTVYIDNSATSNRSTKWRDLRKTRRLEENELKFI